MEKTVQIINSKNYFTIYQKDDIKRPCIVVCPGGGYQYTSPRESRCVALKLIEAGFHAVVLNYREELGVNRAPMNDLAYTIDYLRTDDAPKGINKKQIVALGFSAGGHVVASVGVHFNDLKPLKAKPDLMVLCYPVITTNKKYWHQGSFEKLLGEGINDKELLTYHCIEKNIKKTTPPTFIWSTLTDNSVPVENSILMVEALMKKNINVEFHMYPEGGHGLSLANSETAQGDLNKDNPYVAQWFMMVVSWIKHKLS